MDMTMERVVEATRAAVRGLARIGEVEVVDGEGVGSEVEVIGDEWTVHLEGWPGWPLAFLAIEDEPADGADVTAAREGAMSAAAEMALADLDRRLDGGLRAALMETGDPLSVDLAMALERAVSAD